MPLDEMVGAGAGVGAAASYSFGSVLALVAPLPCKTPLSASPHFSSSKLHFLFVVKAELEIRVCVNRSCSRLGSRQTLDTLSALVPPTVSINSCGCLGRCGAGPNLVVLPDAFYISHCGTAARAAEVLAGICGGNSDPSKNLAALVLRKKGEGELEKGNFFEAEALLSQAIDLEPSGGLHIIHKCRSAARLTLGNHSDALEDAKEAARIAPKYPQAYIHQGDTFLAMNEFDAAENAYSYALSLDPSIRHSKSFKARVAKLREKLAPLMAASFILFSGFKLESAV